MSAIGPQPGPQTAFLATSADIAVYGGAAGAGKTFAELLEPLRHVYNPNFGAVIFRRTYPEISNEGGLWDTSHEIYPQFGGRPNKNDRSWSFPSGMKIAMRHLQHVSSVYAWQGAQVPLFLWDELTHFTRAQFFYLLTRNRSPLSGVRPYMRGSCNPDPDSWVAEFISWWIDQESGFPIDERAGVVRWFVRVGGEIKWAASAEQAAQLDSNPRKARPKSVTFIPATIYDNPILLSADPDYLGNLLAQDIVTQARLLGGNWKIRPTAGILFQRGWYEIVDAVPSGGVCCRFWDFAATARKISQKHDDSEEVGKKEPDKTASCFAKFVNGRMYIIDATEEMLGPADADTQVVNYAKQDLEWSKRHGCTNYMVKWEEEGGASGPRDSAHLYTLLHGFDCEAVRPQGDKITRAKPLARQSKAGNIKLLNGGWVEKWLTHMHNQPTWPHDDIMDASSGCYNALTDDGPFVPASAGTVAIVDAAEIMRQLQHNGRDMMLQRLRDG